MENYKFITFMNMKFKVNTSGEIYKLTSKGWMRKKTYLSHKGYELTTVKKKHIRVHRFIYKAFFPEWDMNNKKLQIDHINRIRNDNRIVNLRVATNAENSQNTNCKGYCWDSTNQCFIARVEPNGKSFSKRCHTEEDAIEAVHQLRIKHFPFYVYDLTEIPEGE